MDAILRKVEDAHRQHLKTLEDNEGQTHFDRVMKREKEDPGVHIREHWNAVAIGQKNADSLMNKVADFNHPDHVDALTTFRDKYNGSRQAVEKDMIGKAVKMMNAPASYLPNDAYERNVLSSYTTRTPEDQMMLDKFKNYMRTKWAAQGYDGDADFYKDFWTAHPMSTPPTKTMGEDGRIYPYVKNN